MQTPRDEAQDDIAGIMAVMIVDRLEAIEGDHHQHAAASPVQLGFDVAHEGIAIAYAGQGIEFGAILGAAPSLDQFAVRLLGTFQRRVGVELRAKEIQLSLVAEHCEVETDRHDPRQRQGHEVVAGGKQEQRRCHERKQKTEENHL